MDFFHLVKNYFVHFFRAGDEHSIHSPFVFSFYSNIIRPRKTYYCFSSIESLRSMLYGNETKIEVMDFGAGGKNGNQKVSHIVKRVEKSPNLAQILFRITNNLQPNNILDLGTSFGLTTLYLSHAAPRAELYTFEGCKNTMELAKQNFKELSCNNIRTILGNIDDTLDTALKSLDRLGLVFFDANHQYRPTIDYFEKCLKKADENSVFIFDDIYWSKEMTKAWKEIIHHPSVMISIDLFHLGIIFFRRNQPKQHFNLKI